MTFLIRAEYTSLENGYNAVNVSIVSPGNGDGPVVGTSAMMWKLADYRRLETDLETALAVVRKAIAEQDAVHHEVEHDATV